MHSVKNPFFPLEIFSFWFNQVFKLVSFVSIRKGNEFQHRSCPSSWLLWSFSHSPTSSSPPLIPKTPPLPPFIFSYLILPPRFSIPHPPSPLLPAGKACGELSVCKSWFDNTCSQVWQCNLCTKEKWLRLEHLNLSERKDGRGRLTGKN